MAGRSSRCGSSRDALGCRGGAGSLGRLGLGHSSHGSHLAVGVSICCLELLERIAIDSMAESNRNVRVPSLSGQKSPVGSQSHVLSEGARDSWSFRISAVAADRGTPGPVDVSLRPLSPSSHDLPWSLLLALSSPETSLPCSSATSSRLTTSAKTPFLMESPSQVPGLRTSMEFFTGHNLSQKTILPGLIIRKK